MPRYHNAEHAKIVKELRDEGKTYAQIASYMSNVTGQKWERYKAKRYFDHTVTN